MAERPRVLASASIADINNGCGFGILECIRLLRTHEMALCLRLKRRRRDSMQTQDGRSFLETVFRMLECQNTGSDLEIDEVMVGVEWRRRPGNNQLPALWIGSETRRISNVPDLSPRDRVPLDIWGPGRTRSLQKRTNEQGAGPHWPYLLIVHPWGPDAIQLVDVPEHLAKTGAMQSIASGQLVQCQLCEQDIHIADFSSSSCWFHPGHLTWVDLSSGSDISFGTADSSDGQVWSCCGALFLTRNKGCMLERQHLNAAQATPTTENGRKWRDTFDLYDDPEEGSEGDSS